MVKNDRPSRGEAEDIANAVFEGCDGFILTNETAVGKNPNEAVTELGKVSFLTFLNDILDHCGS